MPLKGNTAKCQPQIGPRNGNNMAPLNMEAEYYKSFRLCPLRNRSISFPTSNQWLDKFRNKPSEFFLRSLGILPFGFYRLLSLNVFPNKIHQATMACLTVIYLYYPVRHCNLFGWCKISFVSMKDFWHNTLINQLNAKTIYVQLHV